MRGGRVQSYLGMMGQRWVMYGWADDPVQIKDREDDGGDRI